MPEATAETWFADLRELMSGKKYFTGFTLLVEPPHALAFRITSMANREYLIVSLEKRKEQWLIRDIDLDTEYDVKGLHNAKDRGHRIQIPRQEISSVAERRFSFTCQQSTAARGRSRLGEQRSGQSKRV